MSTHKRIAFISTHSRGPWGGSEELWSKTAKELKLEGYDVGVHIFGWHPVPEHIQQLDNIHCVIRRHYGKDSVPNIFFRLINKLSSRKIFKSEGRFKWLDEFKPDLAVISQGEICEDPGWKLACKNRKIPFVCVLQLVSEFQWPYNPNVATLLKEAYPSAERLFFVSNQNMELLRRMIGEKLPNSYVIRNPFKVSYNANTPYPKDASETRLAVVASLNCMHKGQDIILEVLRAEKWRQRKIKIILYGRGNDRKLLETLRDMWNLNNVYFAGFSNNVEDIWKENHALLLGSRMEGLPLALVEAMLCGRVGIVTDVGGNAELVQDNINGFIAKAPTVELMDEAMERAWGRRTEWEELGISAAKRVRELIPADPVKVFSKQLKDLL